MGLTYGSELLKKTATQSFWNSYWNLPDPYEGLIYTRPSTQLSDTYARLGAAPMPQEWYGDKEAKPSREFPFTVTNLPYESTVKIEKHLVQFQQWDEVGRLVGNLGEKARAHKAYLVSQLAQTGAATVCEDGQFYFDTDHANAGAAYTTSQDNDKTTDITTVTAPTDLEMATAIRGMFDAFYAFKDDRGDPMIPTSDASSDFILIVPPLYRSKALQVLVSDSLTGPIGNDLRGLFTVRVDPWLPTPSTTGVMMMYYAGSNHKPFIIQEAAGIRLSDSMKGDENFLTGDIMYSVDWWGRATYGQWRNAVLHTFT